MQHKPNNMKKTFLILAAALSFAACSTNNTDNDSANTQFVSDGQWHKITPEEIPGNFVTAMNDGMLLTAGHEGDLNTMTIGWGEIGKLWRRPVITVYVSSSRYTYEFMENNNYFTVTGFPAEYKNNVMYMGKHSGRDGDKIADGGLHTEFTDMGNPIFTEANIAIECRKMYQCVLDTTMAPTDCRDIYSRFGPHTMYVGEIVNVYRK